MATDDIQELAASLRARQALGRSAGLNRLFDYLVSVALSETRPKEFEVAAAVFGRSSNFDGAQDASVRVAIHRLRRKLEEFYAGPGKDDPIRLSIPKGEYRMVAEPRPPAAGIARSRPRAPWMAALALLAAINLGAWGGFWLTHSGDRNLERARRAQPWSELLRSTAPTLLVLGDYYIFGERDEAAGIDRLVREYDVNSREDLDAWLMKNPKAIGRYRDLDLYYLPIGSAFALRSIAPILAGAGGGMGTDRLRVAMASDLTSDMLKHNNIVYLGYLSGLGVLRGPVFAGSRFAIGDTYDELVDRASGRSYVSQEGGPSAGEASHRDFGYVTAFKGPQGHRIVVIAGTRDVALMQAAEALAAPASLAALKRADKGAENFEALYEVQGIRRNNLNGRLIQAAPRSARNPWAPDANLHFPEG
ncbi:MAG TPA: hypothetical protein VHN73_09185 [Phenylobacterium sp.]|nr:hypothetical protein [Phenylobacterium sp.]